MGEEIQFTDSRFEPSPLSELMELADAIQEASEFIANSWWRRTLINFAGGGKLVITKVPPAPSGEPPA